MFQFPDKLEYSVANIFDKITNWILVHFDNFFDVVKQIIFNIFNGIETALLFVPWWVFIILVFYLGKKYYNYKMAFMLSIMLFAIGMFGLWDEMIYTIVIVLISVLVSVAAGLPVGILMAKSSRVEKILKPILDGMQTMPSFVYLIPAIMLLGLGIVPAVFSTTIYAIPPLIRLTYLGISNVDKEVVEAGKSFGSTGMQMLLKIELPQALPSIMTGVNQTTMMAMAMVVISSMIGARGIGYEVLTAINKLQVGKGLQAGFAIVFLAIILDRIMQGLANSFKGGVNHA